MSAELRRQCVILKIREQNLTSSMAFCPCFCVKASLDNLSSTSSAIFSPAFLIPPPSAHFERCCCFHILPHPWILTWKSCLLLHLVLSSSLLCSGQHLLHPELFLWICLLHSPFLSQSYPSSRLFCLFSVRLFAVILGRVRSRWEEQRETN